MKITAIPGITQILQGHKPLSQQQEIQKKKKRNSNKTTTTLSKRQQEDKGVEQAAAAVLVPYLRGILDNEHPCKCRSTHPVLLAGGHKQGHNCSSMSWPAALCQHWLQYLALCIQRVKLCPVKIKISTFITL